MADGGRIHGFIGLGRDRPDGALVAFANPPASQAAIRGRLGDGDFETRAAAALGFPLERAPQEAFGDDARTAFQLSPDNWLVVDAADPAFGRRLEDDGGLHALDMSSARARLTLEGAAVRDLLAVGATIDLRPARFPAGAFAQTPAGNATTILHATAADRFDVYVARSFAQSWLVWLTQAGREFGLVLAEE